MSDMSEQNMNSWSHHQLITHIEKLKAENKKLRKYILMFQARYMELLPINKKLRECVDKLWEIEPDKTEMLDILQKCLKDIDEDE